MRKLLALAFSFTAVTMFTSCDEDPSTDPVGNGNTLEGGLGVLVESNITSNTTWSADSIYILGGRIAVVSGATLTIEAGTIIKGEAGTGANATALLVAKGGTLNAVGTSSDPIIFTSVADKITVGETISPNLTDDINGLWGGLIILGNARISADNQSEQIEGIPATDANGLYGGTADDDNSGKIQYVSVRHGGANIGEGNEINGITFGGVGSGTVVDHIEVVANQDDGLEFFGGTVSVSHVLVWSNGDDALDTDQAWAGTVDNFIIINPGDEAMELDGPEGSYQGAGHTITNGSVYLGSASGMIDFDENSDVNVTNVYFFGFTSAGQDIEEYAKYAANTKGFASSGFTVKLPTDLVDGDENPITVTIADLFGDAATITTAGTTGFATKSEFSFTFASQSGALTDIGL
ncbi:MAG: hypothetical protein RIC35_02390 [Marinoscillum sp.]